MDKKPIFIVDDEPMLLELALMILTPLGHPLRTFRDPEEALQSFRKENPRPQLIITDYAMHSMTGMDLIRQCRSVDPTVRVLLVSGTVDEDVYEKSEVKPDRFLAKPYHAAQLTDVVQELIEK